MASWPPMSITVWTISPSGGSLLTPISSVTALIISSDASGGIFWYRTTGTFAPPGVGRSVGARFCPRLGVSTSRGGDHVRNDQPQAPVVGQRGRPGDDPPGGEDGPPAHRRGPRGAHARRPRRHRGDRRLGHPHPGGGHPLGGRRRL